MSTESIETPETPGPGSWPSLPRAIESIRDLVLAGLGGQPPFLRVLLIMFGVIAILTSVVPIAFIVRGQYSYALQSLSLGLGFLAVILLISCLARPRRTGTETWSRVVPMQPLPEEVAANIRERLEHIRLEAAECIRKFHPTTTLDATDLRAHVMLPHFRDPPKGVACELRMPEELQLGMAGYEDSDFRFHPTQGVTGRVFAVGVPKIARLTNSLGNDEVWIDDYDILTRQRAKVPDDLEWIISMPIRRPWRGASVTLGVLSIHGMRVVIPRPTLEAVLGTLIPLVYTVMSILTDLRSMRLVRISTSWEQQS